MTAPEKRDSEPSKALAPVERKPKRSLFGTMGVSGMIAIGALVALAIIGWVGSRESGPDGRAEAVSDFCASVGTYQAVIDWRISKNGLGDGFAAAQAFADDVPPEMIEALPVEYRYDARMIVGNAKLVVEHGEIIVNNIRNARWALGQPPKTMDPFETATGRMYLLDSRDALLDWIADLDGLCKPGSGSATVRNFVSEPGSGISARCSEPSKRNSGRPSTIGRRRGGSRRRRRSWMMCRLR